ncbi:MAG: DUF4870 domain-containing protein [Chloroflexota bacterium]
MQLKMDLTPSKEKKLALLAHSSILLTFIVAVTTNGFATLIPILIPFFIWFAYRDRSDYVAFHALQATVYQFASILLFGAFAVGLAIVLLLVWLIVAILSFFIVGLVLIPVAVLLTVLTSTLLAVFPLVSLGYGLVATWEVYARSDFRYRWIADWIENKSPESIEIRSL